MEQNLFKRYIWLYSAIKSSNGISFKDLNEKWLKSSINDSGDPLPKQTFRNHLAALCDLFDVDIPCDRRDNYKYKIKETEYGRVLDDSIISLINLKTAVKEDKSLANRIFIPDYYSTPNLVDFVQYLKELRVVLFAYQRENEEILIQKAEPLALYFASHWYGCFAYLRKQDPNVYECNEMWEPTMVRLDNVIMIEPTDERFERWECVPIETHMEKGSRLREMERSIIETEAENNRLDGFPCDFDLFAFDCEQNPPFKF